MYTVRRSVFCRIRSPGTTIPLIVGGIFKRERRISLGPPARRHGVNQSETPGPHRVTKNRIRGPNKRKRARPPSPTCAHLHGRKRRFWENDSAPRCLSRSLLCSNDRVFGRLHSFVIQHFSATLMNSPFRIAHYSQFPGEEGLKPKPRPGGEGSLGRVSGGT